MANLIVVTFPDKYTADDMLGALRRLQKDDVISIDDAAVIAKDEHGQIQIPSSMQEMVYQARRTGAHSLLGVLAGTLIGLPILGGVLGGVSGKLWDRLTNESLSKAFIRQVRETMPPSSSALFALGEAKDAERAIDELSHWVAQGTLLRADIPEEAMALLDARVTELQQAASTQLEDVTHKIEQVQVIVNPAAGAERPILRPLNAVFRPAGITWDVAITQQGGDFARYAKQAVADGVDAVVVYGGDGSVMEVASALMGTTMPLGIIPGGTGNITSVELGIPYDIQQAASIVIGETSHLRRVDLGQVGDQYFLLRISAGFEADMVRNTSRDAKSRWGRLAYWQAMLSSQIKMNPYMLTIDDETVEIEGFSVMVTNSGNLGLPGLPMLSDISVSDGLLDVVVLRTGSFLAYLANPASNDPGEAVKHWQAREITVATPEPAPTQMDGELTDDTPFTAKVVPAAVKIIVP